MPLLTRLVTAPLIVDIRRGAFDELATVLADQRISTAGRVAIVLGPHSGQALLPNAAAASGCTPTTSPSRPAPSTPRSRWSSRLGAAATTRSSASAAAGCST